MGDVVRMLSRVRGVLADGVVTDEEARSLTAFVRANPEVALGWPGDVLLRRLQAIFEDGRVDEEEREELSLLLNRILEEAGGQGAESGGAEAPAGNALPLDQPPPILRFSDRTFVFAGPLASGSLGRCHLQVVRLGGRYATTVGPATDVLVVGSLPDRGWEETSVGEEVRRALALREEGRQIAIVSEEEFIRALPQDAVRGPRQRS
jgi:hypothetical protein